MEKKTKKGILVAISVLIVATLVLLGLTYAYYRTRVIGNLSEDPSISVTSKVLEITYADGSAYFIPASTSTQEEVTDGIIEGIEPGDSFVKKFSVKNTGDDTVENYVVVLEEIINTFARTEDMTYVLTCEATVGECSGGAGEFPDANESVAINTILPKDGDTESVHNYVLTVSYADLDNVDQSEDMGKEISTKVQIYDSSELLTVEGTIAMSSVEEGDYMEIQSTPKKSQLVVSEDGLYATFKFVGVETGDHTLYLKKSDGTEKAKKNLTITLSNENSINGNVINVTSNSNIAINIGNVSNSELGVELSAETKPNAPVLAEGMIPVIYDSSKQSWVKTGTGEGWYDYSEQKWANAVTVSDASYRTAAVGTAIPMDAINSMWVWIPRFKYKITKLGGKRFINPTNILDKLTKVTNPEMIDIEFESRTNATGVSESVYRAGISDAGLNSNYYTHPAFRDGSKVYNNEPYDIGGWSKELTGLWFAKFETGNTIESQVIKPNVTAVNNQYLADRFIATIGMANGTMNSKTGVVTFASNANNPYGLNTTKNTTNTHISKNTEWGAVAILSQSKYGKMGNNDYSGTNKEIYVNNSTLKYTGRSSGDTMAATSSEAGTCEYNNTINNCGVGASTTGTIYGIYDMSGGSWEHMMAHIKEHTGYLDISGFNGLYQRDRGDNYILYEDGINLPTNEYRDEYDLIDSSSSNYDTILQNAILGDALNETTYWYSDEPSLLYTNIPWVTRGGRFNSNTLAGIFASNYSAGEASANSSYRIVLIP